MPRVPECARSGFRSLHGNESAMLKVTNYILLALDSGSYDLLVLLDLCTPFDIIDHNILLECLESKALRYNGLYLTLRIGNFSVYLGNLSSSSTPFSCGVPHGSIGTFIYFPLCFICPTFFRNATFFLIPYLPSSKA